MTDSNEPKVVSFLSEKEERKITEGKVYADRARAKKRERKERYRARKAEERQEQMSNEEAATQMLRELGSEHGSGTIDSIVGNTFLENSIPEEFRAEFDAIVDAYAPEVDVPDFSTHHRRDDAASTNSAATTRHHARPGPGSSAARRLAAAKNAAEESDGEDADNEDDIESAGDLKCRNVGFESALKSILRPQQQQQDDVSASKDGKKGAVAPKLAGEEAVTNRIRSERAAHKEALEKAKLKKMIMNKAHVAPDITKQDAERKLRLLATKGVVRLFNAISQHQSKIANEKGDFGNSFEQKKSALSKKGKIKNDDSDSDSDLGLDKDLSEPAPKRGKGIAPLSNEDFLSLLRKNSSGNGAAARSFMLPKAVTDTKVDVEEIERRAKEEKERRMMEEGEGGSAAYRGPAGSKGVKWGALKDDFMIGAKMRDWKKDMDEEEDDVVGFDDI